MKQLFILSMACLLGFGLILVSGCSDDDDERTTGDLEDPNYEFISDIAGDVNFQMNTQMLELTFELIDELSRKEKITPGQIAGAEKIDVGYFDIIDYDTSNYWHIVTCSVEVTDEDDVFFAYKGIDSLRASDASSYTYDIDESVTSLDIHSHFNVNLEFSEEDETTSGTIGNHCIFDLGIIDQEDGEFTLDGHAYDSLDLEITSDDGTCDLIMNFSETLTDLAIDSLVMDEGQCPFDGRISLTFDVSMACTGDDELSDLDVDGNWSASFVFDEGMVNIVFENATTRWSDSDQCRFSGTKGGFKRAIERIR